jgi:glucose-1-phosphatase
MPPGLAPGVDAVFLDLGNVLVFHDNALLFRRFAAEAGVDPSHVAERFERELWRDINLGVIGGDAIRREICARLSISLSPERFFELWNCHFTLNNAVLPLVERLVGRVKLVLVSNTNDQHIAWVRPRLPLLERFDALLLSHELRRAKPDPEIFRRALAVAGVSASRAAFFDDLPEYVEAASALGIHGRLFARTEDFPAQLTALGISVQ